MKQIKRTKQYQKVIDNYTKAIELNPNLPQFRFVTLNQQDFIYEYSAVRIKIISLLPGLC